MSEETITWKYLITPQEQEELKLIGLYQPVFPGDVLSKTTCESLMGMKLAMQYEGDYVLTENGKHQFNQLFPELKLGSKNNRK